MPWVRIIIMRSAGIVFTTEQDTFGQQIIQQLHQFVLVTTGIIPNVENQCSGAGRKQILDRGNGLLGAAVIKVVNRNKADSIL